MRDARQAGRQAAARAPSRPALVAAAPGPRDRRDWGIEARRRSQPRRAPSKARPRRSIGIWVVSFRLLWVTLRGIIGQRKPSAAYVAINHRQTGHFHAHRPSFLPYWPARDLRVLLMAMALMPAVPLGIWAAKRLHDRLDERRLCFWCCPLVGHRGPAPAHRQCLEIVRLTVRPPSP